MQLCLHGPSSLGLDPRKNNATRQPTLLSTRQPTTLSARQPTPLSTLPTDNVIHIAESRARASEPLVAH